jgi:hypothetical protein
MHEDGGALPVVSDGALPVVSDGALPVVSDGALVIKGVTELSETSVGEGVIQNDDAAAATRALPLDTPCHWYVLPVCGNGGCLFTSLRLAWELFSALKAVHAHERDGTPLPPPPLLDGHHTNVIRGGEAVRLAIVRWFTEGLDKPLPGGLMLRDKDDAGGIARRITRGDLVAQFLVTDAGKDVPETLQYQVDECTRQYGTRSDHVEAAVDGSKDGSGTDDATGTAVDGSKDGSGTDDATGTAVDGSKDGSDLELRILKLKSDVARRTAQLKLYLDQISLPTTWGSQPEWQAWAYLTQMAFVVYYPNVRPNTRAATDVIATLSVVPPTTERVPKLKAPVPPDVLDLASNDRDLAFEDTDLTSDDASSESDVESIEHGAESTMTDVTATTSEVDATTSEVDATTSEVDDDASLYSLDDASLDDALLDEASLDDALLNEASLDATAKAMGAEHTPELAFAGRLLHCSSHYSVLVTAEQVVMLTRAFPSLEPLFVPLRTYFARGMI